MVTMYGMSDEFGMMGWPPSRTSIWTGLRSHLRPETAAQIDQAGHQDHQDCYAEAIHPERDNQDMLHAITSYLLRRRPSPVTEMMAILEGGTRGWPGAEVSGVSRAMRGPQPSLPSPTAWRPRRNIHIVSDPVAPAPRRRSRAGLIRPTKQDQE